MKTYIQFKKQLLKDKKIAVDYERLSLEFKIIRLFIRRRLEKNFTQKDLARRVGTKQSAVSRFESGEYNPTLNFLRKMAKGLDAEIKITVNARK